MARLADLTPTPSRVRGSDKRDNTEHFRAIVTFMLLKKSCNGLSSALG